YPGGAGAGEHRQPRGPAVAGEAREGGARSPADAGGQDGPQAPGPAHCRETVTLAFSGGDYVSESRARVVKIPVRFSMARWRQQRLIWCCIFSNALNAPLSPLDGLVRLLTPRLKPPCANRLCDA